MSDFFKTGMGRKLIEGTIPRIAQALETIAKEMKEAGKDVVLDTSEFKDPYVSLEIPEDLITHQDLDAGPLNLSIQVKLDDEGVVIDLLRGDGPNNSVATTFKLYQEMADEDD